MQLLPELLVVVFRVHVTIPSWFVPTSFGRLLVTMVVLPLLFIVPPPTNTIEVFVLFITINFWSKYGTACEKGIECSLVSVL